MSWNWFTFWRSWKKPLRAAHAAQRSKRQFEPLTPLRCVRGSERIVIMYTRKGCHLCEQAWQKLEQAQKRYGFTLSQVDIDGDPEWVRAYGKCVPVVMIDGKVRFRGVVNRVLLERLLSR